MALDADSGKLIWEYKFNIFQSDVPPHRVGWASPAADPETGNVYALGVGASLIALSRDGKLLWQRSIGEEFAAFTTHGGRTMSPIIDGDLVIVSAAVSNWGTQAARAHRFIALNKRTGEIVYVANPGGRPYDTAYAAPMIATINGTRLLIAGLGDGAVHAIKSQTGEKVWSFVAAKRAINTGVVVSGNTVIVSHGDENLTGNEMGMIAAIDGSQAGDIKTTNWTHSGEQFGFSSPLIDGSRVYQIENGSRSEGVRPRDRKRAVDAAARDVAESAAGDGRRQDFRRHRKRQVLHRPAARRSRRDPQRGRAADQQGQHRRFRRYRRADIRRRGDFARPRVFRLDRRCVCDWPEAEQES